MTKESDTVYAEIDYENLFGSDSGEDEDPNALRSYFVDQDKFKKFYAVDSRLTLVRGRKGMGKSALLRRQAIKLKDLDDQQNIIIVATGNELIGIGEFTGSSQSQLENHWKQVLCKRIYIEIGKRIKHSLIANEYSLVEGAEIEEFKDTNIVESLEQRLINILGATTRRTHPDEIESLEKSQVMRADLQEFHRSGEKTVWFLIDDVDAKYVDDEAHQQRIGAFFSAIRSLSFGVQGLKIRASVRTDVWKNLRLMEDQDKIRQYIVDIEWTDTMLRSIFVKRILSYLQREGFSPSLRWDAVKNYDSIVGQVFSSPMRWDNKNVEPFLPIKILAGGRPRWMGQLCKLAGLRAGTSLIRIDDIGKAMPEFGGEKISDIQKEHQHQFSDLAKLLDIFRMGKREYNRYQLLDLIEKRYVDKRGGIVPQINGYLFQKPDQLAEFLFQIDFLSAHNDGKGNFISFDKSPELFQTEENAQNKLLWAVNASYRNYLKIL